MLYFSSTKTRLCYPLFTHHLHCQLHLFLQKCFHTHVHVHTVLSSTVSRKTTCSNLFGGNPSYFALRLERYCLQHSKLLVLHHPATICLVNIETASFSSKISFKCSHQLLQSGSCYLTPLRLSLLKITFSFDFLSSLCIWLYSPLFVYFNCKFVTAL